MYCCTVCLLCSVCSVLYTYDNNKLELKQIKSLPGEQKLQETSGLETKQDHCGYFAGGSDPHGTHSPQ